MSSRLAASGEEHQKRRMARAIELDHHLYGKKPFLPNPFQKHLQIFFNLFGIFFGLVLVRWAPTRIANGITAYFTGIKSKRVPPPMDEKSQKNIEAIAKLAEYSRKTLGQEPAVLFVTSHPETSNEEAYRLGDLIYHAVQTSQGCFPKKYLVILQAIDPFALDTLPWWMAGAYAGLIYSAFIPMDRMPGSGTFLQNLLFRKAHFKYTMYHILRNLKSGHPVCAALGGGVIHNQQILYVYREFAQKIYFHSDRKSLAKRECEARVEEILSADHFKSATSGAMSGEQSKALLGLMKDAGIAAAPAEKLLAEFREETALATPYRNRFMTLLIRRICRQCRPFLFIPMMDKKSGQICVNEPVLITDCRKHIRAVSWMKASGDKGELEIGNFVKTFVRKELNEV